MRLLLVEDDHMLGSSLKRALEKHAYGVDWVQDGEAAMFAIEDSRFSAAILDINLPKRSGLDVLKAARARQLNLPILLLTAQGTTFEKIDGFDAGADDYLTKPFDLQELLARLRALIRRSEGRSAPLIRCHDVEIDPAAMSVKKNGVPVIVTAREFRLLKLLMERPDRFFAKSDIEYMLYSAEDAAESNTVEVTIYQLRKKLGGDFIQMMRGVGYRVRP